VRLTLRSLLAFMHGLLGPQEAEDLARKIEESPVARNLMCRIQDLMRQRRLGAPEVDERRANLDPNTVAEYLDHVLPPDRVPDFERICLESDLHLAELTACHQILAAVLTEPIEIPPGTRERMYGLIDKLESGAASPKAESSAEAPPSVVPSTLPQLQSPPRWAIPTWAVSIARIVGTALILILAVAVGGVGLLLVTGQLDRLRPGTTPRLAERSPAATAAVPSNVSLTPRETVEESPPETQLPDLEQEASPSSQAEVERVQEQTSRQQMPLEKPSGEPPADRDQLAQPPDAVTIPDALEQPSSVSMEAEGLQQPEGIAMGFEPGQAQAASPTSVPNNLPPSQEMQMPAVDGPPAAISAPAGELISEGEILLVFDTVASTWKRVSLEQRISAGERYLALPMFRPRCKIGDSIRIEFIGSTEFELGAVATPTLTMRFGRAVVELTSKGTSIGLGSPASRGFIEVIDGPAAVAAEVPGLWSGPVTNEAVGPPGNLRLFWLSGKGRWETAGGPAVELAAMTELSARTGFRASVLEKSPDWSRPSDPPSALEQFAKPIVLDALLPGEAVLIKLRELTQHRRGEVRWLAAQALYSIEDFEPVVGALNEPGQLRWWRELNEMLFRAASAGEPQRRRIEAAFMRYGGQKVNELLAIAYSPEKELTSQGVEVLKGYLSDQSGALRTVATWALERFEMIPPGSFRPDDPPDRRRQSLRRVEDILSKRGNRAQAAGGEQGSGERLQPAAESTFEALDGSSDWPEGLFR